MKLSALNSCGGFDVFPLQLGALVVKPRPVPKTGLKPIPGKPFLFEDLTTGRLSYQPPEPEEKKPAAPVAQSVPAPVEDGWKGGLRDSPKEVGWYKVKSMGSEDRGYFSYWDLTKWSMYVSPSDRSTARGDYLQRRAEKAAPSQNIVLWQNVRAPWDKASAKPDVDYSKFADKDGWIKSADATPAEEGWYVCSISRDSDVRRHWNGSAWSNLGIESNAPEKKRLQEKEAARRETSISYYRWKAGRIIDWE